MKTEIFSWDYNEQSPFIEMLKFQKQNPNLHLYEIVDHGGTFSLFVFASNCNIAKKEAEGFLGGMRLSKKDAVKVL